MKNRLSLAIKRSRLGFHERFEYGHIDDCWEFVNLKADIVNVADDGSFSSIVYKPKERVVDYLLFRSFPEYFLTTQTLFITNTQLIHILLKHAKIHNHKAVKILYWVQNARLKGELHPFSKSIHISYSLRNELSPKSKNYRTQICDVIQENALSIFLYSFEYKKINSISNVLSMEQLHTLYFWVWDFLLWFLALKECSSQILIELYRPWQLLIGTLHLGSVPL